MKKLLLTLVLVNTFTALGTVTTTREYKENLIKELLEKSFKDERTFELMKIRKNNNLGDELAKKEWREYTEIIFEEYFGLFIETEAEKQQFIKDSTERYGEDYKFKMIEEIFGVGFDEMEGQLDDYEDEKTSKESNITVGTYLYPSNTDYITDDFLADQDAKTLPLLRNEIYARHGYMFKKKEYQNYFKSTDWYRPNPNFSENLFNSIEKANIKKIKEYEKNKTKGTFLKFRFVPFYFSTPKTPLSYQRLPLIYLKEQSKLYG